MALRVKISARAAVEVRSAAEWWLANRPAAPDAIGADFGASVALLTEQAGVGAQQLVPICRYRVSRLPVKRET